MLVKGFTYEADMHCNDCAQARFGRDIFSWNEEINSPLDNEGNTVKPVFDTDDAGPWLCADCGAESYHWQMHERAIDNTIDIQCDWMEFTPTGTELDTLRLNVRHEMDLFDLWLEDIEHITTGLVNDIYARRGQAIWDSICADEYDTYAADLLDLAESA